MVDSLQWVENRHLQEENPEVSGTLEQLEGAKREVAELTDRTCELERRLTVVYALCMYGCIIHFHTLLVSI